MSKVSVIIPAYNYGHYVGEAVESALNQNIPELEVIVIDDGSTDNTKDVLEKYISQIKYMYQPNRGLPAARNAGICAASGDYIAFLDADDRWLSNKLQLQMEQFVKHPKVGLIYSDAYILSDKGCEGRLLEKFTKYPVGNVHNKLFQENFIPVCTAIVAKQCFEKVGLFDESLKSAEDYDLWLRLTRFFEVDCVPQPLVMYRKHSANMSADEERMLINKIRVLQKNIENTLPATSNHSMVKNRIALLKYQLGRHYMKIGFYEKAKEHFWSSIKDNAFQLRTFLFLGLMSVGLGTRR